MSRLIPTDDEFHMLFLLQRVLGLDNLMPHDKPDVLSIDKHVGIEVVSCLTEDENKEEFLIEKRQRGLLSTSEQKWLDAYQKYSASKPDDKYNERHLALISHGISMKIQKRKGYASTDRFGIAIYTKYRGNVDEAKLLYTQMFKDFSDELDFAIFVVINSSTIIYVDALVDFACDFSSRQEELDRASWKAYKKAYGKQIEKNKKVKARRKRNLVRKTKIT
jgi:hypothetical protein